MQVASGHRLLRLRHGLEAPQALQERPTALAVALSLVASSKATQRGCEHARMSPLKLQALLYFAQGWHLAVHGEPLFPEPILAWRLGPVVEQVRMATGRLTAHEISLAGWGSGSSGRIVRDEDRAFVEHAFADCAVASARDLAHRARSTAPWQDARGQEAPRAISLASMQRHFGEQP